MNEQLLAPPAATTSAGRGRRVSRFGYITLYRQMLAARLIDDEERRLVSRGEAFFHVSGAGHEATAVFAAHLGAADYLHCHYRAKALMLARGIPIVEFFNGLLCNGSSSSAGRQMSAHLSDPTKRILSIVGPVGNSALQAVGVAAEVKAQADKPIVFCSVGDGTSQQGEFLEAIAEAVRRSLPVLFLIENNRLSISTRTSGMTFFSGPAGDYATFYGIPIRRMDGHDAVVCWESAAVVVEDVRRTRKPALVVMDVERLSDHTNADSERVYRSDLEIEAARQTGDPIAILRRQMILEGVSEQELDQIKQGVQAEVAAAVTGALGASPPVATVVTKAPLPIQLRAALEFRGNGSPSLTMADAIRETLRTRMGADDRISLYGEDIEDPKGDVFGITRGLTTLFPGRVQNAPLSESTIVGMSIGRALAGGRPVAFIQFADFLPLAFNQIATELGSMHWRTNGGWKCPVIIMVACGAYRPGLGPFHAHTFESVIAHVPGLDVVMPSTAPDAAGMLNAAFESHRPTVFFYPKASLNDREHMTSPDVGRQLVPVGHGRVIRSGCDITFVSWGSTVRLCEMVASALTNVGWQAEVIDLRWLSPWDQELVYRSAEKTGKLMVVHEDNRTAGFGAEVVASVAENVGRHVVQHRVTRADTYVPCHFGNQLEVLPSYKSILSAAAEMLDLDLSWEDGPKLPDSTVLVETVGASPADDTVRVAELLVKLGQRVEEGEFLASLECDKAVFEFAAPCGGFVEELFVVVGQQVQVGRPLLSLRVDGDTHHTKQPAREEIRTPRLRQRLLTAPHVVSAPAQSAVVPVGLSGVYSVEGALSVSNRDLVRRFPGTTEGAIFSLSGIEQRSHVSNEQNALSMACEAVARALEGEGLRFADLDMVVCSTSTPPMTSPSMACLILNRLGGNTEVQAYDVSAACTGFLYAIGAGWNHLQANPDARVLVVTAEEMSRVVDPTDFGTSILFGDAATATVLYGKSHYVGSKASLRRPLLRAQGESGATLRVPQQGRGEFVHMDGKKVYVEAVRHMVDMLERACRQEEISVKELDLIVPHQANGRIIEAIRTRLRCSPETIWTDLRHRGNTSSSSIPLALSSILGEPLKKRVGLCAFGAGYTFGATILQPC